MDNCIVNVRERERERERERFIMMNFKMYEIQEDLYLWLI